MKAEVDRQHRAAKRIAKARETVDALQRMDPRNGPSFEDVAYLHEVHARHEHEAGRVHRAAAAAERARRARQRAR